MDSRQGAVVAQPGTSESRPTHVKRGRVWAPSGREGLGAEGGGSPTRVYLARPSLTAEYLAAPARDKDPSPGNPRP